MLESSIQRLDDGRRKWLALAVIVAAQFMVVLDIAIVNVALPSIRDDLDFAPENLQWVVSAYAILFGGALLLGGRLADIFGRRRLFVIGLAIFSGASLLGGLSWSETSLIGFRALQGLGGALFAPAGLSILMTTFAEGRERNRALGIWGAASGSGGAAGVLLGGFLTSYLNWSWVFFINVPVGIAVIAAAPLVLAESRGQGHRHFDVAGAASVTAGVMLLVYAMTRATQEGWGSVATVSLLGASLLLLATFVAIELRSPAPLLPMQIFRNRMLSAANATAAVIGAIAFSEFFLLTLYMQQVLVLRDRDGRRVRRRHVHDHRVLQCGADAGHAAGRALGACHRPHAGRRRAHVVHAAAGFGSLLLEPVPGLPDQRRRPGALVRAGDDRRAGRCAPRGRGHRLRPDQHHPPGGRRRRPGGGDHDRRVVRVHGRRRNRPGTRGSSRRRPHPGLPGRVRRPGRRGGARRRDLRCAAPAPPRGRGGRAAHVPVHSSPRGGCLMMMMTQTPGLHGQQNALLDGTIDDMLLRLRGLVLVGGLLEQRGASAEEVE